MHTVTYLHNDSTRTSRQQARGDLVERFCYFVARCPARISNSELTAVELFLVATMANMSMDDFNVGVTLGTGSFGRVRFAVEKVREGV